MRKFTMKYYVIILIFLSFSSCSIDYLQYSDASFSTVTYVKNTLDYPVLVQCYFRPFNDNPFWCENELIAYNEPVEIQHNDYKIVMDYVHLSGIKIFRGSDNALLLENFDLRKVVPEGILYSSDETKK